MKKGLLIALALTRLVPGLKTFDIKCAWFNENCYNEFFPTAFVAASVKEFRGQILDALSLKSARQFSKGCYGSVVANRRTTHEVLLRARYMA